MKEYDHWALAQFNNLVRQAYEAQQAFDDFNPQTTEDRVKFLELCEEWSAVNRELIRFVLEYHYDIVAQDGGE